MQSNNSTKSNAGEKPRRLPPGCAIVPRYVRFCRFLSAADRDVLEALLSHCHDAFEPVCWPSRKTIAEGCGRNESVVSKSVAWLKETGIIVRTWKAPTPKSSKAVTHYQLAGELDPPPLTADDRAAFMDRKHPSRLREFPVQEISSAGNYGVSPARNDAVSSTRNETVSSRGNTEEAPNGSTHQKNPSEEREELSRVSELLDMWPKHRSLPESQARAHWIEARARHTADAILSAARAYLETEKPDGFTFCVGLGKWFQEKLEPFASHAAAEADKQPMWLGCEDGVRRPNTAMVRWVAGVVAGRSSWSDLGGAFPSEAEIELCTRINAGLEREPHRVFDQSLNLWRPSAPRRPRSLLTQRAMQLMSES